MTNYTLKTNVVLTEDAETMNKLGFVQKPNYILTFLNDGKFNTELNKLDNCDIFVDVYDANGLFATTIRKCFGQFEIYDDTDEWYKPSTELQQFDTFEQVAQYLFDNVRPSNFAFLTTDGTAYAFGNEQAATEYADKFGLTIECTASGRYITECDYELNGFQTQAELVKYMTLNPDATVLPTSYVGKLFRINGTSLVGTCTYGVMDGQVYLKMSDEQVFVISQTKLTLLDN